MQFPIRGGQGITRRRGPRQIPWETRRTTGSPEQCVGPSGAKHPTPRPRPVRWRRSACAGALHRLPPSGKCITARSCHTSNTRPGDQGADIGGELSAPGRHRVRGAAQRCRGQCRKRPPPSGHRTPRQWRSTNRDFRRRCRPGLASAGDPGGIEHPQDITGLASTNCASSLPGHSRVPVLGQSAPSHRRRFTPPNVRERLDPPPQRNPRLVSRVTPPSRDVPDDGPLPLVRQVDVVPRPGQLAK